MNSKQRNWTALHDWRSRKSWERIRKVLLPW